MSVGGVAADRIEVSRNPTLEVRAREPRDVLEDPQLSFVSNIFGDIFFHSPNNINETPITMGTFTNTARRSVTSTTGILHKTSERGTSVPEQCCFEISCSDVRTSTQIDTRSVHRGERRTGVCHHSAAGEPFSVNFGTIKIR